MSDRSVQAAIQKLAGTFLIDPLQLVPATVTSVNQSERTCDCTPIGGNAVTDIEGVQLMGEVDDGFLLIPAIGSTVLVVYSTRNVPYIALFSAIEKVILVTLSGIQFQGGELGGLPTSPGLLERLNLIETSLNAALTALSLPPVTPTIITDIENTSITQGA